ncbi:MAG: hypothetical protein ACLP4V_18450 [Methylocella sp.]
MPNSASPRAQWRKAEAAHRALGEVLQDYLAIAVLARNSRGIAQLMDLHLPARQVF